MTVAAHLASPFSFPLGSTEIVALLDGEIISPVAEIYRLGGSRPTPHKFPFAPSSLSINAYLVRCDIGKVLIDTGAGPLMGETAGHLPDALKTAGYSTDDIDHVILTHIHADHSGALVRDGTRLFPNAMLHISKTEADFWLSPDTPKKVIMTPKLQNHIVRAQEQLAPYREAGHLHMFADNGEILPGFTAISRPGHTPGHVSIRHVSGDASIIFAGDIVHGDSVQFRTPQITVSSDHDQPQAAYSRLCAFREAAHEGYLIAGAHLPFPGIGHITSEADHFAFHPYGAAPRT